MQDFYCGFTSHLAGADPVSSQTHFDLASLTKILATTTLAMVKREQGQLDLDETLSELLPEECKGNSSLAEITVRSLLSHSSGMPAWLPFYEKLIQRFGRQLPAISLSERKNFFDRELYAVKCIPAQAGTVVYSDLGFLILERVLSSNFERDVEKIWKQINGLQFHYRPVVSDAVSSRLAVKAHHESVAMTELCPWRGLLQGQVHDDNTWSRGGVAGHAGVFGRLEDVKLWIASIFSLAIVNETTLREFTSENTLAKGPRKALGFDLPSSDGSGSTGLFFSKNSVGHLGFTGTSLWVDLDSGVYAVLLTNRVHPNRHDVRIRALRREFHQRVRGELT